MRTPRTGKLAGAALLVLLLVTSLPRGARPAAAQQPAIEFTGAVYDAGTGGPIGGVAVRLYQKAPNDQAWSPNPVAGAVTNANGYFQLQATYLQGADYRLREINPAQYESARASAPPPGNAIDGDTIDYASPAFGSYAGNHFYDRPILGPTRTPTAVPTLDLVIDAIEVTQAIQDLDNTVPLVAGKRTYARVHVHANSGDIAGVTARFHLYNWATKTWSGPLVPDNAGGKITVKAAPDRGKVEDSFYLELPPEYTAAGDYAVCLYLNPDHKPAEAEYGNNWRCAHVTFTDSPRLEVVITNIRYQSSGTWYQATSDDVLKLESWLRRAYPVPDVLAYYRITTWGDDRTPGVAGCGSVNSLLAMQRILDKAPANRHYYGLVTDKGGWMRGCAAGIPAYVASGPTGIPAPGDWDTDTSYGDWYGAHELGHSYGRYHTLCSGGEGGPDAGYPYTGGGITGPGNRFYGWDAELLRTYGPGWTDIMTYCPREWMSDYTYKGIRSRLVTEATLSTAVSAMAGDYVAVLGQANLTRGTAELGTLYHLPDLTPLEAPVPGNDWAVWLLDGNGGVLAAYPFTPRTDTEPQQGQDVAASIIETVPWAQGTARVAIAYHQQIVATRLVSAHGPVVHLISTNGGEVVAQSTATVQWQAYDPDGDSIVLALQYSPDAGQTWQTVAMGLTGSSCEVSLSDLAGGGQGRFRLIASDGINTARDEAAAGFVVPNKAPHALVISPAEGNAYIGEQRVSLVGEGYDVEDGPLGDQALSWSSDRQGVLGVGRRLSVKGLLPGRHVITLQAMDGDGLQGSAEVTVYVAPGTGTLYLPLAVKR